MRLKAAIGLVLAVLGAGLLLFVWPTMYRYDHIELRGEGGYGARYPVRIHRITGVAEMLYPRGGWQKMGETRKADKEERTERRAPADPVSIEPPAMRPELSREEKKFEADFREWFARRKKIAPSDVPVVEGVKATPSPSK